MDHKAAEAPALPPGYWTGQHRCEVRYFVQRGTFWVTDGVDVEVAGPREIEVVLEEGSMLADGWIAFPATPVGALGYCSLVGCRRPDLDLDL